MPCRAKLGQRASAVIHQPNGGAIWITDDLLVNAWDRFARTRLRQQSQRCTSNLPGPLEARRRSAKRRMGGSAGTLSDGMGGSFDLGQLFGLRSAVPQYEKEWKWEAPTQLPPPLPQGRWARSWSAHSWLIPKPPKSSWELSMEVPRKTPEEARAESRAAFEGLLSSHNHVEVVQNSDLSLLLDFLQGPKDEPLAENTIPLLDWLLERSLSPSAYLKTVRLVTDKFTLGTLTRREFQSAIHTLPLLASDPKVIQKGHLSLWEAFFLKHEDHSYWEVKDASPDNASVVIYEALVNAAVSLDRFGTSRLSLLHRIRMLSAAGNKRRKRHSVPLFTNYLRRAQSYTGTKREEMSTTISDALQRLLPGKDDSVLSDVTKTLVSDVPARTDHAKASDLPPQIALWLQCLRASYLTSDRPASKQPWLSVYRKLAQRFSPEDLAEHFLQVPSNHQVQALLSCWLPAMVDMDNELAGADPTVLDLTRVKKLQTNTEVIPEDLEGAASAYEQEWQLYHEAKDQQLGEEKPEEARRIRALRPYVLGIQTALDHQIPYTTLMASLLSIAKLAPSPTAAGLLLLQLERKNGLGIPKALALDTLLHCLAQNQPHLAARIFLRMPSLPLTRALDLPIQLAAHPVPSPPQTIFRILERRTPEDAIPLSYRGCSSRLIYADSHVAAVHTVAEAFAANPHYTARVAFRRVWECYRYLRDRGAELQPQLSRAMVKAGLTRPLQERNWVGTRQARYILDIVRRVEGEEVAGDLDKLVWHLRSRLAAKKVGEGREVEGKEEWGREVRFKSRLWVRGESRLGHAIRKAERREGQGQERVRRRSLGKVGDELDFLDEDARPGRVDEEFAVRPQGIVRYVAD